MVDELISRFEALDNDTERRCLEGFLFSLTGVSRILWGENDDPEARLLMMVQVSQINRRVLKRVLALADGDRDTFFTTAYTWRAINDHAAAIPALHGWVTKTADGILKEAGA